MRLVRRAEHRGDAEDAKYAEDRLNEDKTWCPRNFLHTYRLALPGEKWALTPAHTLPFRSRPCFVFVHFRFRDVPSEEDLESSGYGPVQDISLCHVRFKVLNTKPEQIETADGRLQPASSRSND